ncbi:MAG: branched-chain amino acid ABC transporter permease, partial [Candidatus Omnitrophica bacterium]|nr:branched-chain amino acid ABC transporter permease [Candidatus Omnitrophota bacterium]
DFILSVMILSMVVLGGMGSVRGAIVGALLLGSLPELLRGFEQYRMLVFGLAMIVMMRLRPQGLFGGAGRRLASRDRRAHAAA